MNQPAAASHPGLALSSETPLSKLTTMRVGGPAEELRVARTAEELVQHAVELWRTGDDWLLLGGGSNTVVHDDGYPGVVVLARNEGFEAVADETLPRGSVRLRVQAGQDWDALVAETVERGWAGIEALSGIPGLAGAAPVQNIGAYGCELEDVLHSIEFLERGDDETHRMSVADLELGYRDSAIKQGLEGVVVSIDLVLSDRSAPQRLGRHGVAADAAAAAADQAVTAPVRYGQLAGALGVELGAEVPIREIRDAVLRLRGSKGMVLDAADHDTWSSGSFFTNPIVTTSFARTLPENAPRFPVAPKQAQPEYAVTSFEELAQGVPLRRPQAAPDQGVKLSAAWLIENAGVPKGFKIPGSGAAISSKHTLALTNRGAASAEDVAELARFVVQRVQQEFGVILVPEPRVYGLDI